MRPWYLWMIKDKGKAQNSNAHEGPQGKNTLTSYVVWKFNEMHYDFKNDQLLFERMKDG